MVQIMTRTNHSVLRSATNCYGLAEWKNDPSRSFKRFETISAAARRLIVAHEDLGTGEPMSTKVLVQQILR